MATKLRGPQLRKITVSLPTHLLDRLNEMIPSRQRSHFIIQAIEERLAIEEQLAALDETAGAWSDENHPDLDSPEAIERWVRELRKTWDRPFIEVDEPDAR
jgi:Arc/MetJ-type ribon-helix-helix transcriptional regulator